eukprot:3742788-Alexandrium_andersonii.AAC.1
MHSDLSQARKPSSQARPTVCAVLARNARTVARARISAGPPGRPVRHSRSFRATQNPQGRE